MWKNRHTHTHKGNNENGKKINLIQLSNENVKMKSKATKKKRRKILDSSKKKTFREIESEGSNTNKQTKKFGKILFLKNVHRKTLN